ncbi:PheS-related mystery ligase SrmL [Luteipulveratus halotolerans]|uniref:Phenylalanyl-tRNA synthetase subunit alpha n=1 Tax=Luteipulveratus halotolerans TaxID=1631356 RepID=A0A0L6CEL3_9MICO|nr:hypothetical protein [Luteipulveratus halotolerans]KNX36124.1 phenylalanyl-tRNA synthetase subunit alpha [Luteipulveratus halotolerans]
MTDHLTPAQLADALALRDLTDPDQGPHAAQLLLTALTDALRDMWPHTPVDVVRSSPLVSVADNYDHLGYDPAAVTRDARYTRYVGPSVMLRSHTSAGVPPLLQGIARDSPTAYDRLHLLPGLVHRRDAIDRTHVGAPHQVDVWRLSRGERRTPDELAEMIGAVVEAVLPGARWRAVDAEHPYTVDGRQVDVRHGGEWLELAECGLVDPDLLARCGLDPDLWSGLALGMGIERALMLRKGIHDIRLLRATDPRIAEQMLDLDPWRPVSMQPAIRRDLSLVVGWSADEETIGDRVRLALGPRESLLEAVRLLARSTYDDLPDQARRRLQLRPGQVNALVRLTLRPLDRTLTHEEANVIRDEVYRAVHEGAVLELIG